MISFQLKLNFRILFGLFMILTLTLGGCESTTTEPQPSGDGSPSVAITTPLNDAKVADLVEITANATDDKGIVNVEFYVDNSRVGSDPAPPYRAVWNSSSQEHGSAHSVYAIAFDADGNSTSSVVVFCTIDSAVGNPAPVIFYPPIEITDSSVSVSWSPSAETDFASYTLYYDTSSAGAPNMFSVIISDASDTTRLIGGLFDNTDYRFQVTVDDAFGKTALSGVVGAKTLNSAPPIPTLFSVTRDTDILRFSWSFANITDFQQYNIVRSADSLFEISDQVIATIMDIKTTSFDYNTSDTTSFYYFITVIDNTGLSSVSDYKFNVSSSPNFALQFDGTTYATIPYFSSLDLGGNYTLEAWINQTARATYMRVIDKSPTGSPFLQYSLISDATLGADLCGDGGPRRFHGSAGIALNEWHHVGLTYNNGVIIYYIDGLPVDTSATGIVTGCAFPTTLNIGRRKMFDEFYFVGIIDEVRVWNLVRTPEQIAASYNSHLSGAESGLVSYFDFDEGVGNTLVSPVGNNGHLGETVGNDSRDPIWVESTAPIVY